MTHQEYLQYLKQTKNLNNEVQARYQLDESSPYYRLQQARNQIYNEYMDRQIQREEIKVMEEMVSNYLRNMSIDVSLDGQKLSDAIVKEITKGFKR